MKLLYRLVMLPWPLLPLPIRCGRRWSRHPCTPWRVYKVSTNATNADRQDILAAGKKCLQKYMQ